MKFILKIVNFFKKQELTPWYPADIKPVRVGTYQVKCVTKYFCEYFYAYWDGKEWLNKEKQYPLIYQDREWRGLTK